MPKTAVREDRPHRAQPRRPCGRAQRGAEQRERAPALPPVRHHRQRLRQLPDPLPRQRRGHLRAQAARRRRHLPLRGPGLDDRALRLALLPLPLSCAAAPEEAPSCAEAGVLGVLPGIVGVLQATEVVKLILGSGDPSPAACSTSTPWTCASASSACRAIRSARSAARTRPSPSPSTTRASARFRSPGRRRSSPLRRGRLRSDRSRAPRGAPSPRLSRSGRGTPQHLGEGGRVLEVGRWPAPGITASSPAGEDGGRRAPRRG